MFTETPFIRKKKRNEVIAKCFFGFMAAAMVIPLFLIVGYIVVQGPPAISWEFLTENPRGGGAKGSICADTVATFTRPLVSESLTMPVASPPNIKGSVIATAAALAAGEVVAGAIEVDGALYRCRRPSP